MNKLTPTLLALAMSLAACGDDDAAYVRNAPAEWLTNEDAMLAIINSHRLAGADCGGEGVFEPTSPLIMDTSLRDLAALHSLDMGNSGFFSHDNLAGKSPFDRMRDAGFNGAQPWGENIQAGSATAEAAMQSLMNSDGHCANIMNPSYSVIGVGYAQVDGSDWNHYWTQKFAAGPSTSDE